MQPETLQMLPAPQRTSLRGCGSSQQRWNTFQAPGRSKDASSDQTQSVNSFTGPTTFPKQNPERSAARSPLVAHTHIHTHKKRARTARLGTTSPSTESYISKRNE